MKKSVLGFIALLLSSCASSPDYSESLQVWIGANQQSLTNAWGNPATINYLTANQQLLTYFQISPNGEEFCRTTFTVTDGSVTDFEFEGDNCQVSAEM
ncbi:MAG: hypothetical protein IJ660_05280 [Alphaproteobacteria bacterium]|nr:hypothetical protein [Alphaproteobacteria bacterium]